MRLESGLFFRCIFDILLTVWLFSSVPAAQNPEKWRYLLAALTMLPQIVIYVFIDHIGSDLFRLLYRVLWYICYLRILKQISWHRCLYFSLIAWLAINVCTSMFVTPVLRSHYFITSMQSFTVYTLVICCVYFFLMTITRCLIPFDQILTVTLGRFVIVGLLISAQLYIKRSVNALTVMTYQGPRELSSYIILLQLVILGSLICFEQFCQQKLVSEQERRKALVNRYLLENAVAQQAAEEEVHRVHHDMKNHLLAICSIVPDNERLREYIGSLMERLSEYDHVINTGNTVLDGLLSSKIRSAAAHGVNVSADLDFRPCSFVKDTDLCTLFGNMMDNAIEASEKVRDEDFKSVMLRGRVSAGSYILTCSNYYEEKPFFRDGSFVTTKQDALHHGFGISSIKAVVHAYNGTLSFADQEHRRFVLTILLPLPDIAIAPQPDKKC